MCNRNLVRKDGVLQDTFNPESLKGKPSDYGFLGIPTLSDAVCNFFTFRWLGKLLFDH